MSRHLETCAQKQPLSEKGGSPSKQRRTDTFHLFVEGLYDRDYWMHLEIPLHTTFGALDGFLRDIWLECCGHLSQFIIQGPRGCTAPFGGPEEVDMESKLGEVLAAGTKFQHEYDFGSTTHLVLKAVSVWKDRPAAEPVRILARNEAPEIFCDECKERPATEICTECMWSGGGWLCDECAADHECGEDMFLPVVNSPRVGTCGYTGGGGLWTT